MKDATTERHWLPGVALDRDVSIWMLEGRLLNRSGLVRREGR